jgi:O-antigen/teichoic acid export membrane protein
MTTSIRGRFFFTVGANVFRGLLSFITGMLLARLLGPESFGSMAFLLGTFMGVLKLLDMGSSSAFFTFMSQKPRSKRFVRSFFTWLAFQFLLPLCVIGLLFPTQWVEVVWHGEKLSLVLLAFTAIFMQGPVWSAIQNAGESQRRTHWIQSISVVVATVHLLAVIFLWLVGWLGLYAIFFAIIFEYLVAAIIAHKRFSYNKEVIDTASSLEEPILRKYLDYCLPLIPYSWVGFFYIFTDRWLLQNYSGSVEQAYYAISAQFATVALIITTSILRIFWKEVAEARKQDDNERVRRLYQKVSRLLFFVGSVIAGFLIPWAEELLKNILGEAYVGGVTTLTIMFLYPIFQSAGQIGSTMLYACEKISIQSKIGIIFMIVSMIVTYFILAPSDAVLPGLNLASEGLAMKMVVMAFIQVNILAYIIARIWNWPFDWVYQPVGLLGCVGLGWIVNAGATSFIGEMFPWFVTLFVSGVFYIFLVAILVYIMPWLIGMTRKEIYLAFNVGFKKLQSFCRV